MSLKLTDKVAEFLRQREEERFTARQIAEWVVETYPDECRQKQERSTATTPIDSEEALLQQLSAEIGSKRLTLQKNKKYGQKIKTTETRPRQYYFTKLTDNAEIDPVDSSNGNRVSTANAPAKEEDLYPKLSLFLRTELEIYSMRINDQQSKNSHGPGGNKWLHPDLVGIEDLSGDWNSKVKECVPLHADKKVKLWSFEVKRRINRANVREAFFQAVSNSSWANFGYLVAGEIDDHALKELRMLASLHGIGFIRLEVANPSESQIMIPTKERNKIDWDIANRLTEENPNFLQYIIRVCEFYQTGKVKEHEWDAPLPAKD